MTATTNDSFGSYPSEIHELLVTYEGPFHPLHSSYGGKTRKTFRICLPSAVSCEGVQDSEHENENTSCYVLEQDILHALAIETGWPASMLCLPNAPAKLIPFTSIHLNDPPHATIHQHPPLTAKIHPRHSSIQGGKGGFGTLLKGQSKQAGARTTLDFGACRDLSGRRLRHVNDEIKLRKFRALQEARERGEEVDELAALKTESGIRNWHLMVPHWSEGAILSAKGRRRTERQLEKEVRGWQSREERMQRQREQKRMDEEWAVMEYVRRGEVEGERIAATSCGEAIKEGILAQLRKRKEEKRSLERKHPREDSGEEVANVAPPSTDELIHDTSSSSHLMTLSGEVSLFDIPNDKQQQQSLRLQSQSDFATAVVLLDGAKLASSLKYGKKGVYIEYTIQTAGLAQIGWIRTPDSKSEDSTRFLPNSDTGDGVGDDAASFGYDGSRGLKFHDGKELPYGQDFTWKTGDVLGCWCILAYGNNNESEAIVEIGYTLNGLDLGVAFSIPSSSTDDLCRYFPAASLNLGEVVDIHMRPNHAKEGCADVSTLIVAESDCSYDNNGVEVDFGLKDSERVTIEEDSSSPPTKKPREEKVESESSSDQIDRRTESVQRSEHADDDLTFDLNSCKSIDEVLAMDPMKLRNILLSMGVKCGGTPQERAERLFSLKGLKREDYPKKVRGKNFIL
ncbi:hypothetical protein HJC23_010058 [Cyclotella cryptica]|uniref:SPRY domain-containing protein n=1 Tax=Cyclotella cryptica TaxID=29204 RepID=A0ABD3Q369_9STRA|eukprot:CCRYP_009036-RA/>CCRYP_009036-RA protein AED:0.01 eAED:0.01 QI:131/1/1/1/1/0.66/3/4600/680